MLTEEQKKKFFEILLLEKDYTKSRLKFDLVGIPIDSSLDNWLKSYYKSLNGYDPCIDESPDFKLSDEFGDAWIDDIVDMCLEEERILV